MNFCQRSNSFFQTCDGNCLSSFPSVSLGLWEGPGALGVLRGSELPELPSRPAQGTKASAAINTLPKREASPGNSGFFWDLQISVFWQSKLLRTRPVLETTGTDTKATGKIFIFHFNFFFPEKKLTINTIYTCMWIYFFLFSAFLSYEIELYCCWTKG